MAEKKRRAFRLAVVGGVTGGASVAARVRRLNAQAEIIIFERGEHVSFSNCCLPYYLSGTIADSQELILMSPLLQQGILALGFTKEYQYIITGLIVIAAVYADVSARRRKN